MFGAHFAVGFANVNFDDVEPRCRRAFPQVAQIRVRRAPKRLFFPRIHGEHGTAGIVFRARFDFDENECFAVARDEVDLVFPRAKVAAKNFHAALFFQKIGGEFFSGITAFPPPRFLFLRRIFPEKFAENALEKINDGEKCVPNSGSDDFRKKPPYATQHKSEYFVHAPVSNLRDLLSENTNRKSF